MSIRRKYEPARGVVSLKWESGAPVTYYTGIVLLEVWTTVWHWNELGTVSVKARIIAAQRQGENRELHSLATGQLVAQGPHEQIRRWCPIHTDTTSYPSLTLSDWKV